MFIKYCKIYEVYSKIFSQYPRASFQVQRESPVGCVMKARRFAKMGKCVQEGHRNFAFLPGALC